jgi:glycosyltransferase involved in cell wall biosynthesis
VTSTASPTGLAAGPSKARGVPLVVAGVRNPRSLGISRYASLLERALVEEQVEYRLAKRTRGDDPTHFHLANSSRALLLDGSSQRAPFVVTVHDVIPRLRALAPLYRARVYPQLASRARAVIVHSAFAADLLGRTAGRRPARLEVIPHPAPRPRSGDRLAARRALDWSEDSLIAVLPGVIKEAKLVREALAALPGANGWQIALAGRLRDRRAARAAVAQGALVLADPGDTAYEHAIVAADCVLCLRASSVGETNGPLLDALGASRAVLATPTGSIPEVGRDAVSYCAGSEDAIRAGLLRLSSEDARAELEQAASKRAAELTWEGSAALHAAIFREAFDG